MQIPLLVRPPTGAERDALEAGLRSSRAFTLRRAQIVLASARGDHVPAIARALGCDEQTVRNAIRAFADRGVAALSPGSSRPHTVHAAFAAAGAERLKDLLHRSPRDFGQPDQPLDARSGGRNRARRGLDRRPRQRRDGARHAGPAQGPLEAGQALDRQPRPGVRPKKSARDRPIRLATAHPAWALGFADEVWWSRVARPAVRAWTATGQPLRLVERAVAKGEQKALACYGLLARGWEKPLGNGPSEALWLRFVAGRPISGVATQYLARCCAKLAAAGKTALLLAWGNASGHGSREVSAWIAAHNRQVKAGDAPVRIVACPLPIKSPWLNPIEPKWVHGKRRVVEPARPLTREELECRVYDAPGADHADHLTMPAKAA
jgi:hypothetical protein